MFDVEQRIASWRASMAASLGEKKDVIDELESHLREQLHRLALEGHAAEAAWDRALERLGRPRQLAEEFDKNVPAMPLRWIAAWLVLASYPIAGLGLAVAAWRRGDGFPVAAGDGLLGLHVITVSMGYWAVLAFGALAIWSLVARAVAGWDARKAARLRWWAQRFCGAGLLLSLIGVVTGALWAHENWGRFWGWDAKEIGGAAVIAWIVVALWQLGRPGRTGASGWILGLIGNMVVWCAWFGPNLIGNGLHSYGPATSFALVFGIFMGVHAVLLAWVVMISRRALDSREFLS